MTESEDSDFSASGGRRLTFDDMLELEALQAKLEEKLELFSGICGVGLSYDQDTNGPAFKVYLSDIQNSSDMPEEIDEIVINYEQAPDIEAY